MAGASRIATLQADTSLEFTRTYPLRELDNDRRAGWPGRTRNGENVLARADTAKSNNEQSLVHRGNRAIEESIQLRRSFRLVR